MLRWRTTPSPGSSGPSPIPPLDIARVLPHVDWPYWRPVQGLSVLALDRSFGYGRLGLVDGGLLPYVAAATLVGVLARALFRRSELAVAATLLFALSPLHVPSAPSLYLRSETLAVLFSLCALLAAYAIATEDHARVGPIVGLFSAIVLALLSKETAYATIPLVLALVWVVNRERALRVLLTSSCGVLLVLGLRLYAVGPTCSVPVPSCQPYVASDSLSIAGAFLSGLAGNLHPIYGDFTSIPAIGAALLAAALLLLVLLMSARHLAGYGCHLVEWQTIWLVGALLPMELVAASQARTFTPAVDGQPLCSVHQVCPSVFAVLLLTRFVVGRVDRTVPLWRLAGFGVAYVLATVPAFGVLNL